MKVTGCYVLYRSEMEKAQLLSQQREQTLSERVEQLEREKKEAEDKLVDTSEENQRQVCVECVDM